MCKGSHTTEVPLKPDNPQVVQKEADQVDSEQRDP